MKPKTIGGLNKSSRRKTNTPYKPSTAKQMQDAHNQKNKRTAK